MSDLRTIPGVGPSISADLRDLGIRGVTDLEGRDPRRLYESLSNLRGVRQDPCVLYVFRSSVYFAETGGPDPELVKWWNWKDRVHPNERTGMAHGARPERGPAHDRDEERRP